MNLSALQALKDLLRLARSFGHFFKQQVGGSKIAARQRARHVTLPPLESDGTTAKWFGAWRRIF